MIPTKYSYLTADGMPRMIQEGLKLVGTKEVMGDGNSPIILAWAKEVGESVANVYKADSIPWCGLAMAVIAKRAEKEVVKDPLWALNWGTFGEAVDVPELGDILTFVRKTPDGKRAGHVAQYVGEDADAYHIMGGNQSDAFGFTRMLKTRLYAARRPHYTNKPVTVKRYFLKADGTVSNNEQ